MTILGALASGGVFTGLVVIVGIVGSWVVWHVGRRHDRMNRVAEFEMREWLEPYGTSRHGLTGYTAEDHAAAAVDGRRVPVRCDPVPVGSTRW